MNRRSFLQRAAAAVALTLATVYAPSLKAVAVEAKPARYKIVCKLSANSPWNPVNAMLVPLEYCDKSPTVA